MRLLGRTAIITGAASGIGRASAELFAQEGAEILAVDLPGKGLAEACKTHKSTAALEKSVADADAAEIIIGWAERHWGRLDILFSNAGVATNSLAEAMPLADWERTQAVNLRAPFLLSQTAIPLLKQSKHGRIINTASIMAQGTDYGLAAYCAAKAGLTGLTRTLALELGKYGITANCILPGAIRTGMTQGLWDANPQIAEIWAKKSALRRLGEPIDIARVALFLASDDGAFMTGQDLCVDGGLMLRV